jgi:hypothetical protein
VSLVNQGLVARLLIHERFMKVHSETMSAAPIVQWEFEKDHRRLTCAIRVAPCAPSYEVTTMSLWHGARIAVQTFDSSRAAFHRHAAIAADLRAAGWTVAAYTASTP